jgi:hypothetical protein
MALALGQSDHARLRRTMTQEKGLFWPLKDRVYPPVRGAGSDREVKEISNRRNAAPER